MKLIGIIAVLLLSSWASQAGDKDSKNFTFLIASGKQAGSHPFMPPWGPGCNLAEIEDWVRQAAAYPITQRKIAVSVDPDASPANLIQLLALFAKYEVKDVGLSTKGTRVLIKNLQSSTY